MTSKTGALIESKLAYILLGSLVYDQTKERLFLCLKSVGSFIDCSIFSKHTSEYNEDYNDNWDDVAVYVRRLTPDKIYALQINSIEVHPRNVIKIVS